MADQPSSALPTSGATPIDVTTAPVAQASAESKPDQPQQPTVAAGAIGGDGKVERRKNPHDEMLYVGLVIGYVGTTFRGLQFNRGIENAWTDTVEGRLLLAMSDAKVLPVNLRETGSSGLSFLRFGRASRTDKGVSAARNVVSMTVHQSLVWTEPMRQRFIDRVNQELADPSDKSLPPSQIRMFCVIRVPKEFVPRRLTTRRVYHYLIPAFALDRRCDDFALKGALLPFHRFFAVLLDRGKAQLPDSPGAATTLQGGGVAPTARLMAPNTPPGTPQRLMTDSCTNAQEGKGSTVVGSIRTGDNYALASALTEEVHAYFSSLAETADGVAQKFTGSHRFHNFTESPHLPADKGRYTKVKACEQEAVRVIIRACVSATPVFLRNPKSTPRADGSVEVFPYLMFQVEGASFLLHMIRKLVGSLMAVCRGARPGLIDEALDGTKLVTTPMAPAPYLYLHTSFLDVYDRQAVKRYPPFKSKWGALEKEEEIEDFELSAIYGDICAIDRSGSGIRPSPDEEKEQEQAGSAGPPVVSPHPSPMSKFAKYLRVHNWSIRKNPYPPTGKRFQAEMAAKAEQAEKAKALEAERKRIRDEATESAGGDESVAKAPALEGTCLSSPTAASCSDTAASQRHGSMSQAASPKPAACSIPTAPPKDGWMTPGHLLRLNAKILSGRPMASTDELFPLAEIADHEAIEAEWRRKKEERAAARAAEAVENSTAAVVASEAAVKPDGELGDAVEDNDDDEDDATPAEAPVAVEQSPQNLANDEPSKKPQRVLPTPKYVIRHAGLDPNGPAPGPGVTPTFVPSKTTWVFTDVTAPSGSRDTEEEVLRRQQEAATAEGGDE